MVNEPSAWDELSSLEKAVKIAQRLLGPPKLEGGIYVSSHAAESLLAGDLVALEPPSTAKKWNGTGLPNGIAMCRIDKGNFGWVQTK